jgi:hypothetical protein
MRQLLDIRVLLPEHEFFDPNLFRFAQLDTLNLGVTPDKFLPNLLAAIIILVVGLIAAYIAAAITKGILKRTNLDERIAGWLGYAERDSSSASIETVFSSVVFWIVMVFALLAALDALKLTVVSVPLQGFLSQIMGFLPLLAGSLLLAAIAWGVATVVKLISTRSLHAIGLDQQFQALSGTPGSTQPAISETIGNVLYALVFLFFLPLILNALGLQVAAQPILQLLNQGLGVLLNVIGAGFIAAVGWYLAKFVGRLVTNLLSAAGLDQLGSRFGLNPGTGGQSLSQIAGTIVYVAILIPIGIAALQVLKIEAISVPAIAMLNQILNALPKILTAAVIVAIAFLIGQFIAGLVTNILTGIGFDQIFTGLGLPTPAISSSTAPARTPSQVAGIVVQVGIVLFGIMTATDVLQLPALTALVTSIIAVLGQILSSLAVFAVGLYLANLAFRLIASSGGSQAVILGHAARISIIALISAMALRQMGVATDIVNLAFGLLLGAIAVAIALAFGLGGRDIASEQVREWLTSFKQNRPETPPPRGSVPSTSMGNPTTPTMDWPPGEREDWS